MASELQIVRRAPSSYSNSPSAHLPWVSWYCRVRYSFQQRGLELETHLVWEGVYAAQSHLVDQRGGNVSPPLPGTVTSGDALTGLTPHHTVQGEQVCWPYEWAPQGKRVRWREPEASLRKTLPNIQHLKSEAGDVDLVDN